jgi:hypothetical protein
MATCPCRPSRRWCASNSACCSIDQEAALASLPSMLPPDGETQRTAFGLIKQLLAARGEMSAQDRNRLNDVGRLFGVDEDASVPTRALQCVALAGFCLYLSPADRAKQEAIVADRNSPRKLCWRAEIVLGTADGLGTNAIMRRTGKSKPCVWRWRRRVSRRSPLVPSISAMTDLRPGGNPLSAPEH